jgi:NADP-dependent alcohol dehydrogenase
MVQFRLRNPTEILFGSGQVSALPELIPSGTRVLLLYGGGSIKANGVYDAVTRGLAKCEVAEFGGIETNPVYETILRAAQVARAARSAFVLAVGGGSTVDAGKFLAAVIPLEVADPWDHLVAAGSFPGTLPVGVVLTLPATGSESNQVSVITRRDRGIKVPFANEFARPRFAILDPGYMRSLSRRQLENGVVDAFTHVLEQYFTRPVNTPIQYGFSETILKTLIAWGPRLIEEGSDEARENVMWAANQALNGVIGAGVPQDWSTHMIGHAITAIYDTDHARTLSMVMPAVMRYRLDAKLDMLVRYAREVWDIREPDRRRAAEAAIERTEAFFTRMGCPTRTSQIEQGAVDVDRIVAHLERAGQTVLGEGSDIGVDDVRRILAIAA